jgi:hypothetical protein
MPRKEGDKLKKWKYLDMKKAVEAAKEGSAVAKAARTFDVPRATLIRHLKGVFL